MIPPQILGAPSKLHELPIQRVAGLPADEVARRYEQDLEPVGWLLRRAAAAGSALRESEAKRDLREDRSRTASIGPQTGAAGFSIAPVRSFTGVRSLQ